MEKTDNLTLPGLSGLRIAITAGASGIGRTIADRLWHMGAKVALCDIDKTALENAHLKLRGAVTCCADVAQEEDVKAFFNCVSAEFGGLDALINNAGIAGPTGCIEELRSEDIRACLDVGLFGQFLCSKYAVPLIRGAGGGSIICMSSVAGKHGYPLRTPYAATKFGVIGLAKSLAKELGPANIRVNALLPGIVEGPRIEAVIADRAATENVSNKEMRDQYLSKVSLGRMVSSGDVADMTAFLLSEAGKNISGQSIAVDGNVETL